MESQIKQLENDQYLITIHARGAELQRIFNKQTKIEYLWDADPAVWGKHAPVLFPIVGTLKDDTYYIDGKAYQMGRHGFAREMDFKVEQQEKDKVSFVLESNENTRTKFPFDFRFEVTYQLSANKLTTTYHVSNTGSVTMYFSVGGHPAFRLPLAAGLVYSDYYLAFNEPETAPRWPISKDGLIEKNPLPLLNNTRRLPLTKELFQKDALVFKKLSSTSVSLKTDKDEHGLTFDFSGFPYLGIWAAKNADFVCIEPWCGIADSVNSNQQLPDKEGIEKLAPAAMFERSWTASFH